MAIPETVSSLQPFEGTGIYYFVRENGLASGKTQPTFRRLLELKCSNVSRLGAPHFPPWVAAMCAVMLERRWLSTHHKYSTTHLSKVRLDSACPRVSRK